MKYFFYVIVIFLLGCNVTNKIPNNHKMLTRIHQSQKAYYNSVIAQKDDFTNLLKFSVKGRSDIYKKSKVELNSFKSFVILEGYSNGWGNYVGFLLTDSKKRFYSKSQSSSEWTFIEFNSNSPDFEKNTGVSPELIKTIQTWDTTYINSLKKQTGNIVNDGFSFWANKIDLVQNNLTISNYTFYQYPIKK